MTEQIINLTPHTINLPHVAIPSTGSARVGVSSEVVSSYAGVAIYESVYGEVTGLPEEAVGVNYIVSRMVAAAVPERTDLLVPSGLVRDDKGRIVGCLGLEQV